MRKRPVSVTVLAWLLILTGVGASGSIAGCPMSRF